MIQKSKKNKGFFFHKAPEIKGITVAKSQALIDITKECLIDDYFTMNYVAIESRILKACSCEMQILRINTNLL